MVEYSEIIINPFKFYDQKIQSESKLTMSFLIVLAYSLLLTIANIFMGLYIFKFVTYSDEILKKIFQSTVMFTLIYNGLSNLIIWIIITLLFYIVAKLFFEKVSSKKMIELTGYAFLPPVIYSIIFLGITFFLFLNDSPAFTIDAVNQDLILKYIYNIPTLKILNYIKYIFFGWSLWLCLIYIKKMFKTNYVKALIIIVVPLLVLFGCSRIAKIITQYFIM